MLTRRICANQDAFSLIEVVVAILILFIISLAMAFMITWAGRIAMSSRVRVVATKLATNVIEEIKAYQYNNVGFTDSSPQGVFVRTLNADNVTYSYSLVSLPAAQVVDINGIKYTPQINIWWQVAPGVVGGQGVVEFPADYKMIDVTVTAVSDGTGSQIQSVDIKNDISFEGETQANPGGNLYVTAHREGSASATLEGIGLSLIDGPTGMNQINASTDETGTALISGGPSSPIIAGGYVLHSFTPDPTQWIIQPDLVDQNLNLQNLIITYGDVPVDHPCTLTITLTDSGGNLLPGNTSGTLILTTPWNAGNVPILFKNNPFSLFLWPEGPDSSTESHSSYPTFTVIANTISGNNYLPYTLNETDAYNPNPLWNGQFSEPGTTQSLTVKLIKACTVVTVNDAGSGAPVAGARVEIDWQSSTYNHISGWGAWQPVAQTVCNSTDALGQALFSDLTNGTDLSNPLGQDKSYAPPPTPVDGNMYYRFVLSVSVSDANQSDIPNNHFYPTTYSTTISSAFPAGTSAPLTPAAGSNDIRVWTEYTTNYAQGYYTDYSQGYPRWNVTIEASGPITTFATETPSNGPGVIFKNVTPGVYTLSRQNGSGWSVIAQPNGQQNWVVNLGDYQVIASW